jgi:protein-tyrosine phosphatase
MPAGNQDNQRAGASQDPSLPPGASVIVPGELYIGGRPSEGLLAPLQAAGVSAILSLQEEHEAPPPTARARQELLWERVPLADSQAEVAIGQQGLARAVETLQRWRADGQQVYLHCQHGVGRAPTVAAAYLIAEHGLSLGDAVTRVKRARPAANFSAQQLGALSAYATGRPTRPAQ